MRNVDSVVEQWTVQLWPQQAATATNTRLDIWFTHFCREFIFCRDSLLFWGALLANIWWEERTGLRSKIRIKNSCNHIFPFVYFASQSTSRKLLLSASPHTTHTSYCLSPYQLTSCQSGMPPHTTTLLVLLLVLLNFQESWIIDWSHILLWLSFSSFPFTTFSVGTITSGDKRLFWSFPKNNLSWKV